MTSMRVLLVPIKAFHDSKLRLAPVLSPAERDALARDLAARVIRAAAGIPVAVVCDDHDVAAFAEGLGADVLWTPGLGLSGAVGRGVEVLASRGATTVTVAHADLPHAERLDAIGLDGSVTLVPDRHRDGTNVASVPAQAGFVFHYGPGSFGRHIAEAASLGLNVEVLEDERLATDVDRPGDLAFVDAPVGG